MKKTRILLVHNPLVSLFMSAWFKQVCVRDKGEWQTVGVYVSRDFDESYSADIENKKSIYKKACLAPLETIVDKWVDCMPNRYAVFCSIRRPIELIKERHIRTRELKNINNTLIRNGIHLINVNEIWYSNSSFTPHFLYLCPNAAKYRIEHALPEFYNEEIHQLISETNPELPIRSGFLDNSFAKLFIEIKKRLLIKIHKKLLFFMYDNKNMDMHLSILGDEINSTKPVNTRVKNICTQEVISITKAMMKTDPTYLLNKKLEGNTAIVLLMHLRPKPWGLKERKELLDYFESFENYLCEDMDEIFRKNKIKNIIIKSRFFHEEHSEEGFSRFNKLAIKYNLFFLSSISQSNYPAEFYLPVIKPTMLVGCLSAALYYTKKLFPDIQTYTYDDWFCNYIIRHLNVMHPEIIPIREILFNVHRRAFRNVLPQGIDDNYTLDINKAKHTKKLGIF